MTVLEVLGSCSQRIQGIRLPVAEVESTLQLAQVVDDIQACINTLAAYADQGASSGSEAADQEAPEVAISADEDLFGEAEQTEEREAGGEDDERSDV